MWFADLLAWSQLLAVKLVKEGKEEGTLHVQVVTVRRL
jgi:hypothetical protein